MKGHVTWSWEVYIFIFENVWACSVDVVVEYKTSILVVTGSMLGQVKSNLDRVMVKLEINPLINFKAVSAATLEYL